MQMTTIFIVLCILKAPRRFFFRTMMLYDSQRSSEIPLNFSVFIFWITPRTLAKWTPAHSVESDLLASLLDDA